MQNRKIEDIFIESMGTKLYLIGQDFQACHYFLISQNPHESFQWGVDTYWSINLLTLISFPGMKKSLGGEVGQVNQYFGTSSTCSLKPPAPEQQMSLEFSNEGYSVTQRRQRG